jgi:hypothetical protein
MEVITTAIPKLARRSISFRPYLSAKLPHKGETIAAIKKVDPKAIPAHLLMELVS